MIALFITLAALLVLAILLLIFYPRISRALMRKNFVRAYGKKIYKIALYNDFYLINQVCLESHDNQTANINHLLFGNKYIYLISDYYFRGELHAKENDNSWVYHPVDKKQKVRYIDNPLFINHALVEEVSKITGIDESLFIAVVVINTDCDVKGFESKNKTNFLVHINKLPKLVDTIENRDVSPLKDKSLYYAVQDIARLNLNKGNRR